MNAQNFLVITASYEIIQSCAWFWVTSKPWIDNCYASKAGPTTPSLFMTSMKRSSIYLQHKCSFFLVFHWFFFPSKLEEIRFLADPEKAPIDTASIYLTRKMNSSKGELSCAQLISWEFFETVQWICLPNKYLAKFRIY